MLLLTVYLLFSTSKFNLINTYNKKRAEEEKRKMRQQNFPSLFSVFDALSGFSAFVVVVVNLILIGGRSIKPVPISNPLSPLSTSLYLSLPHQFRRCSCNSAFYVASALPLYVCVCVVAGFSLIFSVLCTLCTHFPSPPFHALPLLLLLLTIVVQGHIANVFVLLFRLVFMSLFLFICFLSTRKALCSHCAQCS